MYVRKIDLKEFQTRKLERSYISVYVIVKKMIIETQNGIEPRNLCIFYGFTALGARRVIAIYFEDTQDNRFWLNVFQDFKARNLQNIMFLVTPQNKNIERCARIVYNDIEVVRSPEDIMASIDIFFPVKTSRYLEIQLKSLLLADDLHACKEKVELFKQQFFDNKLVLTVFERQQNDIFDLYRYCYDIRKLLYQYYAIREFKRQVNQLNERQPLLANIIMVHEHLLDYISSFERGLAYSKKGWVRLMNIFYELYPKKMEVYF